MRENLGTVLISLCYTPETKKLSIIILRAKDLNKGNGRDTGLCVEEEGKGVIILCPCSHRFCVQLTELVLCPDPTQFTQGEGIWYYNSKNLGLVRLIVLTSVLVQ